MSSPVATPQTLAAAMEHLSNADAILAPIVAAAGTPAIAPHDRYYERLVQSIIGQQLSVKAAHAIRERFLGLFANITLQADFPTPDQVLAISYDDLRGCGLSSAKASYILDLSIRTSAGEINFEQFPSLSNQEIITELTTGKGIGEWTAQMFLIFCMGRLDVLAKGDLGVRNAILRLYQLPLIPTPAYVAGLAAANNWHPYESVACWYLWRSLDNEPV